MYSDIVYIPISSKLSYIIIIYLDRTKTGKIKVFDTDRMFYSQSYIELIKIQ